MKYIKNKATVPIIGVEAEYLGWKGSTTYTDKAKIITDMGYMPKGEYTKGSWHQYHCKCKSCKLIGSAIHVPVQFKMEYDGSLPEDGAEFISSPFPALPEFMGEVANVLSVVGEDRKLDKNLPAKNGGHASAGFHVHCSVSISDKDNKLAHNIYNESRRVFLHYFPEIFLLASSTGYQRGLKFRMPHMNNNNHHNWLVVTKPSSIYESGGSHGHLEWRIFEPDWDNEDYVYGSMVLASSLTFILTEPKILDALEAIGLFSKWNREIEHMPFEAMSEDKWVEYIMERVSPKRLEILEYVLKNVNYSDEVNERVNQYFARAWQSIS